MNRRMRSDRSGLLMLELLLAVGIFAFCAAVCLGLFGKADALSQRSAALSRGVLEARNVSELFKSTGGDLTETAALAGGWVEQGLLRVAYDGDWHPLPSEEGASYLLDLLVDRTGGGCVEGSLTLWGPEDEALLAWPVAALEAAS